MSGFGQQNKACDVVVIGAGIVGTACALELARCGLSVMVVDSGEVGGGATGAAMGHITVLDDSEAQFALTRYSQQLWREMREELPPEVEWLPCGTIWLAADEEEMAEVRRKHAFYEARGVPVEMLDSSQLAEAEPNLRKGLAGGLLVSEDVVIYPPTAAAWLLKQAQGATVVRERVAAFDDGGVTLAGGSQISAGKIIHASGAWTCELVPGLKMFPRKGHLLITERYEGFLRHQLVELGYLKSTHAVATDSVAFNAQPRATGQILIGSSRQYGATDTKVESKMMARMLQRACEYMPGIAHLQGLRAWTGFRAATPDKLPLIGPAAGYRNVHLATGHEGLGITTSTGTAKLLADQLLGRESAIPFEPYLPARINEQKQDVHG